MLTKVIRCFQGLSSYQVILVTFMSLIAGGTLLLMLPFVTVQGQSMNFLDALFTATSASCVTGLVIEDTGTYFNVYGQLIIVGLIQLGGLGLMTIATLFTIAFNKKITLQDRLRIQESLNESEITGVVKMCIRVARFTIALEFIFGSMLAWHLYGLMGAKGIYYGYWHSISAFCNAGFDLLGNFSSFTAYATDVPVNLILISLIILGSMGFNVLEDVIHTRNWARLRLHSKLVLTTTGFLLVVGTLGFFLLEYSNTLAPFSFGHKLLASFFQAVTPRTAGFNTLDMTQIKPAGSILLVVLMFIGASPASTGGGIKTTTFAVSVLAIKNLLHSRSELVVFNRQISDTYMQRSFAIVCLSVVWVMTATLLMTAFEATSMERAMFEVVSAFATVGLSNGLSQEIGMGGKIILIMTMFAGRVGVLTFVLALTSKRKTDRVRYPKEKIMVG